MTGPGRRASTPVRSSRPGEKTGRFVRQDVEPFTNVITADPRGRSGTGPPPPEAAGAWSHSRLDHRQILAWLREEDPERLADLWDRADRVRTAHLGNAVHLRGLVEFSNACRRRCTYCGLRAANHQLVRYSMTAEEILACAAEAHARGYGTLVLQSGEDPHLSTVWLGSLIKRIKDNYPLAVTLSVGERPGEDYRYWRECGADRYLLKTETSDRELFSRLHPPLAPDLPDRTTLLAMLRELGYEIGGGIMVGLPGQTYANVAQDIELFSALDLDMIGIGAYLPHPETPLGLEFLAGGHPVFDQIPNSELATLKVLALARLVCPEANIPATTALASVSASGYEQGLRCGANVIMPNLTPAAFRHRYDIYPSAVRQGGQGQLDVIEKAIAAAGRCRGEGRGDRRRAGSGPTTAAPSPQD
jgi:biotin synthase